MKNYRNEEMWNISFTSVEKLNNSSQICSLSKLQYIENHLLALGYINPKTSKDYQSRLMTVNKQNKSVSFNLQTIIEIILEGLETNQEFPLIPFINKQGISNISMVEPGLFEGIYNNRNILLAEHKVFPLNNNIILFQDYNSYFRLNSPFFPKLIGQTHLDKSFLMIDKPQGRTLLELLDNDQMIPNMLSSFDNYKLIITLKIIEAVEDIHNSKKILAFLNPETITISSNFDIYFTGIYKSVNQLSVYSSPFLLMNNNNYSFTELDYNLDIWSLGCLIYFIFSGKHPFDNNIEKAVKHIKNESYFYPDDVRLNSKIKELVKMCCNVKSQEKINSVHSLKLFLIISNQSFFKINFKGVLKKKGEKFDEVLGFYKPVIKMIFSYLNHNQLNEIQNKILNKKVFKAVYDLQNRYKNVIIKNLSLITETKPIYSLSHFIEKDKDILIVAGVDTYIKLYNLTNKKIINKLASDSTTYLIHRYTVDNKEFLLCYCKEKLFKIFDLKLRELERVIKIDEPNISAITILQIDTIAYTSEKNIYILNLLESKVKSVLTGHFNSVKCLAYLNNYDRNLLASGSWDSTVKIWNISTGQCLNTFYSHKGSVISIIHLYQYCKELVGSSSTRESTIKIWNFNTLEVYMNLNGHNGPVLSLLYLNSLHPSLICSSANEEIDSIKIWDLDRKESIATLKGQETTIKSMIFIKNGKGYFNLITASEDCIIRIWELDESFTDK